MRKYVSDSGPRPVKQLSKTALMGRTVHVPPAILRLIGGEGGLLHLDLEIFIGEVKW